MARRKRSYARPLVITLAALGPACGSATDGDGDFTSGVGGTASDGTGGTGGSGYSVNPPPIPPCTAEDFEESGDGTICTPGDECLMQTTTCTSQESESFMFQCKGENSPRWSFQSFSCSRPYESCRTIDGVGGSIDCLDRSWRFSGGGGNPPALCPDTKPDEGSFCSPGGNFAADREACGYPCDDGGEWTVVGCTGDGYEEGEWTSDGACEGAGGVGGAIQ